MSSTVLGEKTGYRVWEKFLIFLALLLVLLSGALYFGGISLRSFFPGLLGDLEKVGILSKAPGDVRRQHNSEVGFNNIDEGVDLFNLDTVVTSPEAGAVITLDDGGIIEMGPSTMIRLSFELSWSLDGISRAANVQLVTGQVAGQTNGDSKILLHSKDRTVAAGRTKATLGNLVPKVETPPAPVVAEAPPAAPPAPVPVTPSRAKIVSPKPGSRLRIPSGSQIASRKVDISWDVEPRLENALVKLVRVNGKTVTPVLEEKTSLARGKYSATLSSPGVYEARLIQVLTPAEPGVEQAIAEEKVLAESRFEVERTFEAIEVLDPLVGGKKIESNFYRGEHLEEFDITLRWKPYPGARKYDILLLSDPKAEKPIFRRRVTGTTYELNKDKVYSGQIYFRVIAHLPSGFQVTSRTEPFKFVFQPPILVSPDDKAVLSRTDLGEKETVLLTWRKTNFTREYEVEVAADPQFKKVVLKRRVRENFAVFRAPPSGTFYWRVKSLARNISSKPSKVFQISFTR